MHMLGCMHACMHRACIARMRACNMRGDSFRTHCPWHHGMLLTHGAPGLPWWLFRRGFPGGVSCPGVYECPGHWCLARHFPPSCLLAPPPFPPARPVPDPPPLAVSMASHGLRSEVIARTSEGLPPPRPDGENQRTSMKTLRKAARETPTITSLTMIMNLRGHRNENNDTQCKSMFRKTMSSVTNVATKTPHILSIARETAMNIYIYMKCTERNERIQTTH